MSNKERQRSQRLQQHQHQKLEQQLQQPISRFDYMRFNPEPAFSIDKDVDKNSDEFQLTAPHKRALRTSTRGYKCKVCIGSEHQAEVPDYQSEQQQQCMRNLESLIWSPKESRSDSPLREYMNVATQQKHYSIEQALTLLQDNSHDYSDALKQRTNYTTTNALWPHEERQRFEFLLRRHGTSFERIKQFMPWRSIAELLDYYYTWVPAQNDVSYLKLLRMWKMVPDAESKAEVAVQLPPQLSLALKPPYSNEELLDLAKNNCSSCSCADMKQKIALLQAQILSQRRQLADKSALVLDNQNEIRRSLKQSVSRNFREWRPLDKQLLMFALQDHGCNFGLIARIVRTKTELQVQKYYEDNKQELQVHVKELTGVEPINTVQHESKEGIENDSHDDVEQK